MATKQAVAKKGVKGKGKGKAKEVPLVGEAAFEKTLATLGLADSLQIADVYNDINYEVTSTGWPGLDLLIGGPRVDQRGWPAHVHAEIFSELEHVGKTSIALGIGVAWQLVGKKVGIVDIEPSITPDYLRQLGYITSKAEAEKKSKELGIQIYPVRLLRPNIRPEACETDMVYVEKVLNVVAVASNVFDLLIIDSVDAMVSEADAAKVSGENDQMGGVAKPIKSHMRKNTVRNSSCIWINHQSVGLGMYAKSYTSGGKAIPRYSTIRLKLDRVDFLRETDKGDPIGFITKVSTIKNRMAGGIGKSTNLYYLFGEGFSIDYDYFLTAQKAGLITKSGAWMYVGNKDDSKLTIQGVLNMYHALKDDNPEIFRWVKSQIDGEDVAPELAREELTDEQKLESMDLDVEDEADDETEDPVEVVAEGSLEAA